MPAKTANRHTFFRTHTLCIAAAVVAIASCLLPLLQAEGVQADVHRAPVPTTPTNLGDPVVETLVAVPTPSAASDTHETRAMWVWERPDSNLIPFAIDANINTLFLHVGPGFSSDPYFETLLNLTDDAAIDVWAVAGDPAWTEDPTPLLGWIDEVVAYERFVGVAPDVEPWATEAWLSESERSRLITHYLQALEQAEVRTGALDFNPTVPFWFDDPNLIAGDTLLIDLVMDISDSVTVMAYRDHAVGTDGILEHAQYEINRAEALGIGVFVAVETGNVTPAKITFFEEGRDALERELQLVTDSFGDSPAFEGIVIHHYASFSVLD